MLINRRKKQDIVVTRKEIMDKLNEFSERYEGIIRDIIKSYHKMSHEEFEDYLNRLQKALDEP